jgi:hypothetical protein
MIHDEFGPTLRNQGPDEVRERLTRVLTRLRAHTLEVPPGSRVARFINLSERFAAKELSPAGVGTFRDVNELLEANRDFVEFAMIVEHLLPPQPPVDSPLLSKLHLVLGGATLPSEDANSLARNTQFELYVAALCARAGLMPRLREPDFIVTVGGLRLGIAAKRAGGPNVRGLVKDGARQLRKAGLDGLVALNLDRLFAPNDQRLAADSAEGLKPAATGIVGRTVRPYLAALERDAAGSPALAILAFVVVSFVVPRDNGIGRVQSVWLREIRRMTAVQIDALRQLHQALGRSQGP